MLPFEADGGHEGGVGAAVVGDLDFVAAAPEVVATPEVFVKFFLAAL